MSEGRIVAVTLRDGSVAKGLSLFSPEAEADRATSGRKPLVVDFLNPTLRHRTANGSDSEMIVKAIGVKKSEREGKTIFDFTAGLGVEAFLLATSGFDVVGFERDPLIYELLEDGIRRLRAVEPAVRLRFLMSDAAKFRLGEGDARPYAVTMDPMYEETSTRSKSKPKKGMAVFRELLKPSTDTELQSMLENALSTATARVLVKRPTGFPPIVGPHRPVRRLEGKTASFDIYTCRA